MTQPLALHNRHVQAEATMTALGDREMVAGYGDVSGEVGSIRTRAGIIDWGGGTRLRLTHTGERTAYDFLDGLLSNQVPEPPTVLGCYATLLTNTGKIIADCRVWAQAEGLLVTNESPAGATLRDTLTKYGFLDDITVADMSDDMGMLGLYGPESAVAFEAATGEPLPGVEPMALISLEVLGGTIHVTRSRASGEVGFDILGDPTVLGRLWQACIEADVAPVGLDAFHVARVEAGTPWMGAELDDQVLPNQVNLDHAISYAKGCYVGQEAVAKLHYLGRSNKQLVGLLLGDAAPPARGADVAADGKTVGRVTSAVVSPAKGQTIALALCKPNVAEPGTELVVGGEHAATVASLPFCASTDSAAQFSVADVREEHEPPH